MSDCANTYHFSYESADYESNGPFPLQKNVNTSIVVSDHLSWPTVVREFAHFMTSIYGYNIAERLLIEEWDGKHIRLSDFE